MWSRIQYWNIMSSAIKLFSTMTKIKGKNKYRLSMSSFQTSLSSQNSMYSQGSPDESPPQDLSPDDDGTHRNMLHGSKKLRDPVTFPMQILRKSSASAPDLVTRARSGGLDTILEDVEFTNEEGTQWSFGTPSNSHGENSNRATLWSVTNAVLEMVSSVLLFYFLFIDTKSWSFMCNRNLVHRWNFQDRQCMHVKQEFILCSWVLW